MQETAIEFLSHFKATFDTDFYKYAIFLGRPKSQMQQHSFTLQDITQHSRMVQPYFQPRNDSLTDCILSLHQVAEVHTDSSSIMLWLVQKLFDGTTFVGIYLSFEMFIHDITLSFAVLMKIFPHTSFNH